jgi:hypothetical protein
MVMGDNGCDMCNYHKHGLGWLAHGVWLAGGADCLLLPPVTMGGTRGYCVMMV